MDKTSLACACGTLRLELTGAPILSSECCCNSCRTAGTRMQSLPGAPHLLTDYGATPLVIYCKDRVRIAGGADQLAGFRLTAKSPTRRIVATCCNTPAFMDFEPAHWLSLYSPLWPAGTCPRPQMRTMTEDMDDRSQLSNDIPNPKKHTASFFLRLIGAWAAMGFRRPKVPVPRDLTV